MPLSTARRTVAIASSRVVLPQPCPSPPPPSVSALTGHNCPSWRVSMTSPSEIFRQRDVLRPRRGDHRVAEQAGNRHETDATRHRRDRARDLRDIGEVDIADEPCLALAFFRRAHTVDADIDDDGTG